MEADRSKPFSDNVEKIVKLAKEALERRSATAKIGTWITSGFGTMASVILHIAVIVAWCVINLGYFPVVRPFDPFPFNLLTLIVSFESVLIALFVLLTQNRMSREADLRAHLNLQMSILVEQELTAVLQLITKVAEKQGIGNEDTQVNQLLEPTDVEVLADELEKKLPGDV